MEWNNRDHDYEFVSDTYAAPNGTERNGLLFEKILRHPSCKITMP